MSIALDASTPARWSGTCTDGQTIVSAAFTAPTGAALVVVIEADADVSGTNSTVVSDSGGLTWTSQVERANTEATNGGSSNIRTAITASAVSRTITVTFNHSAGSSTAKRVSAVCYVFTGADTAGTPFDTVGANNEGGSGTNNLTTTSLTPGATGVLVGVGTEWNALGACTSSDLKGVDGIAGSSHAEYAGAIDVMDGWKVCTSGVGVTGNLDAAGSGTAQWKWCQIIVRQAAAAATSLPPFNSQRTRFYSKRRAA